MTPKKHLPTEPAEPSRGAELTIDEIVTAAVSLIRQHGIGGMSMRQLASVLGVTPMAIYYHVKNKEALLDLATDRIMQSAAPADQDKGWKDRIKTLILDLQHLYHDYPGLARYAADHMSSLAALRYIEMIMQIFQEAGFEGPAAAKAMTLIGFYNNPASLRIDRPAGAGFWDELSQSSIARRLSGVSSDFPNLRKALPHLRPANEADFRRGLDRLIEGIAADLEAARGDPKPTRQRARKAVSDAG